MRVNKYITLWHFGIMNVAKGNEGIRWMGKRECMSQVTSRWESSGDRK